MGSQRGGLGRGLAALIPTAESSEHDALTAQERMLHSLVNAGLDQLDETMPLDLAAYLHLPHHGEPMLYLRRPRIGTLTPSRAYRLFSRIVQAVRGGATEGTFSQDDYVAVFLRTPGAHSDGLHVLGREHAVVDASTLPAVRVTARTFATITNQAIANPPADVVAPRLLVELGTAGTTVRIVETPGAEFSDGEATTLDAQEAVVRATLVAAGSSLAYQEAREVPTEAGRAVLVVLTDAASVPHPGFVVSSDDVLQATALATVRAITGR
jgi:hypothetical protein